MKTQIQITRMWSIKIKGALSDLRQFLAAGSPLRIMKNTFYFISKALLVLKIFKVGLSTSIKNCVSFFIESPLKIMKNAFYFILKTFFVLKIFNF